MLNKIKKSLFIILSFTFLLFVQIKDVNASTSYNSSLNPSKTTVNAGETFSISLGISNLPSSGLGSVTYKITFDNNLFEYKSNSNSSFIESVSGNEITLGFMDMSASNPLRSGTTLTFKSKNTMGKGTFSLSSTGIRSGDGETLISNNTGTSVQVYIPSSDANLKKLSISDGTLNKKSDTEYTATVDVSSITISATPADKGRVEGIGKHNLNYGLNTFKVISKAEDGTTKTYTLNITRPDNRNGDVNLKTLEPIDGFIMGTTLYNVAIPSNQSTYKVIGTPSNAKSSITYSPSNGEVSLNKGETKTITVTVTAENGKTKIYTVNVTRKDDRSKDNDLKNLNIKDIDLKFKSSTTSYTITIENNIEEIEINGEASDKNAKVEGFGNHKINVGSNTIRIVVIAENESKKTYTITIVRKDENGNVEQLSNNTKIKNIKINDQNLNIKDNVFTYSLSVENNISIVDLTYVLEDEKATAIIEGNNELVVGNNKFKIIVTAEDGTTKTYEILIERKESNNTIENNKDKILEAIKNQEFDTITITVKNDDSNRIIDKEILEELKKQDKILIYQVLNEYQGLSYSVTINSKNITSTSDNLDYELSFKCKNKDAIDSLSNNSKSICLSFNANEKLPALTSFKVFVGDKFNDKDKLYLYYFNEKENKLELVKSNLDIKDSYVEFDLSHFSEYILVDSIIEKNNITSSSNDSSKIIITGIGLFLVVGLMIFIVIKNKKNKLKEKNISVVDNNKDKEDIKSEVNDISLKDEVKTEKQETNTIDSNDNKVINTETGNVSIKDEINNENKDVDNTKSNEIDDVEIIDM